jgi:hypothetical protein
MTSMRFLAGGIKLILVICLTGCSQLQDINQTPTLQLDSTQITIPTDTPIATETPIHTITQQSEIPSATFIPFTLDSVNEEVSLSIRNANKIINGLELFFEGEGYYPDNLDSLIPVYLENVPLTFTLNAFDYSLSKPDTYILFFNVSRAGKSWYCGYLRASELWDCSGNGSLEHNPNNVHDFEGLYGDNNLMGYMTYQGNLSKIYNTIVIHYESDYDNFGVLGVQEVEMQSGFYERH